MAVLQHAPAGYLLSVPLTELQITIKESCLSFLLASRKTYSGSFTLIFIHLVIDKCGSVSMFPSPSRAVPGHFCITHPPSTAPAGVQGAWPHERHSWEWGTPLHWRKPPRCCGQEKLWVMLFYLSSFPRSQRGSVAGATGAAQAASARCISQRIFSQLREAQTWK